LGADATWTDFPQSTALDLCENNATSTCLTGHEYESPTFEDLPTAEAFKYETSTNIKKEDTKLDDKNLKLSDLPTDAAKFDKQT